MTIERSHFDRLYRAHAADAFRRARRLLGDEAEAHEVVHDVCDVPLQFSIELDDTPGVETVHALFCPESFEIEPLRAALERTRRLPVPAGCHVDTRTLHREAAR